VAFGRARLFAGNVVQEDAGGAELQMEHELALAEDCVCIGKGEGCLDPGTPQTMVLHDLLASSDSARVETVGPSEVVAVRHTRAVLSPGVNVRAPICAEEDGPGCLSFKGPPRLDDLPLWVRVEGDATSTPIAALISTNPHGDAVPEIALGDCASGSLSVRVGLVGHPTAEARFDVRCTDDLPAARAPVSVSRFTGEIRATIVPTTPATLAVLSAPSPTTTELTWLALDPPRTIVTQRFDSATPVAVLGFADGGARIAIAIVENDVARVRSFLASGEQLIAAGVASATCTTSLCVESTPCSRSGCTHDPAVRLHAADFDGDGRAEIAAVSKSGGITIYPSDLGSCGQGGDLGADHLAETFARFGGPVPGRPTLIAAENLNIRFTYAEGPAPSCRQGLPIASNATNAARAVAHGKMRPGAFEDVVLMAQGGVPRMLLGGEAKLGGDKAPQRDAFLTPRTAEGLDPPRDARALAIGDVSGDGLDDLVVAYATTLRTWIGGDGLPGEAREIALASCEVGGVFVADGAIVVLCGGEVRRISW